MILNRLNPDSTIRKRTNQAGQLFVTYRPALSWTISGAVFVAVMCLIGCAGSSSSTGIIGVINEKPSLPVELPNSVAVMQFFGDIRITRYAADEMSNGMLSIGFEVVDRPRIEAAMAELEMLPGDFIDSTERAQLSGRLNVEGFVIGSIGCKTGISRVAAQLNVKLIDAATGKTIWAAEARDSRLLNWNKDVRKSTTYTVGKVLESLRKDIREFEKRTGALKVEQDEEPPAGD